MENRKERSSQPPLIGSEQIAVLEKLSNMISVSGDEAEVRALVLEEVRPYADDVKVDALGNVLVTCKAQVENPLRVMLAAHMDEVGFMLTNKDEGGLFSFVTIGGIDIRQLPGKPVLVGNKRSPGVIGARPIHLTTPEERERTIPLDSLRIDLGPGGGELAKPGDRASFATVFRQLGPSLLGKALDNRLGVATLIELIKHAPANVELLVAFTVQEEVGLRGARVAAYAFNPDLAIAVDSTPANDLPTWDGSENTQYNTRLGAGPAVYVADSRTLSDPRLVRYLLETGEKNAIPVQVRQPGGGGTDAGAIHMAQTGVPTVSVSVPGRYAHTAAGLARLDDWKNTMALLHTALRDMSPDILKIDRY
jgi:tetrahedral aminopeptidase